MKSFKDLGIAPTVADTLVGRKIEIDAIINKPITVHSFQIKPSKHPKPGAETCLYLQIELHDEMRVVFTGSMVLQRVINKIPIDDFPFTTTIIKENRGFHFT